LQEAPGKYQMAEAVREAYGSGEDDETLEPRVLIDARGNPIGRFRDGDYIIFYNLRGEREVELCQSLLDKEFSHFPVERNLRLNMVTMIPYHQELKARVEGLRVGESHSRRLLSERQEPQTFPRRRKNRCSHPQRRCSI